MVRHADIERSQLVCAKYPLIADAAKVISDPLVRNRGTVGGALAHADPAGDWGAVMLALGAELVAIGPSGERAIPIDDFFVSLFQSALLPDELLIEIRVPLPQEHSSGAYCKLERKVGDFATVAVAAQITLDQNGGCEAVGLGLTAVGPKNLRATSAEDFLRGKTPDAASIKTAGELAAQDSSPTADLRGSVALSGTWSGC